MCELLFPCIRANIKTLLQFFPEPERGDFHWHPLTSTLQQYHDVHDTFFNEKNLVPKLYSTLKIFFTLSDEPIYIEACKVTSNQTYLVIKKEIVWRSFCKQI